VFLLVGAGLYAGRLHRPRPHERFYDRLHARRLGTSWGPAGSSGVDGLLHTVLEARPVPARVPDRRLRHGQHPDHADAARPRRPLSRPCEGRTDVPPTWTSRGRARGPDSDEAAAPTSQKAGSTGCRCGEVAPPAPTVPLRWCLSDALGALLPTRWRLA
jgi:hypothetical protein